MADSYSLCEDPYLYSRGYRKLSLKNHNYVFIFTVEGNTVYLHGFFHVLENYRVKL